MRPNLKYFVFMVCNTSSTVGIGYGLRMIAWFACLMSTHRRISPLFFGIITTGLTPGARPSTGSIIPMSKQFCGLISDLSSRIKWYPSIRLCNRFYSGIYIQGYLFVFQFSDTLKYLWVLLFCSLP